MCQQQQPLCDEEKYSSTHFVVAIICQEAASSSTQTSAFARASKVFASDGKVGTHVCEQCRRVSFDIVVSEVRLSFCRHGLQVATVDLLECTARLRPALKLRWPGMYPLWPICTWCARQSCLCTKVRPRFNLHNQVSQNAHRGNAFGPGPLLAQRVGGTPETALRRVSPR